LKLFRELYKSDFDIYFAATISEIHKLLCRIDEEVLTGKAVLIIVKVND